MAACTCADPMAIVNALNKNHEEFMRTFYGASMTDDKFGHSNDGKATGDADTTTASGLISSSNAGGGSGGTGGVPNAGIAPIRFANWAAPEISDKGESIWNKLWKAAALAISIYNTVQQGKIAEQQQDLADSYYGMAKKKLDRFGGEKFLNAKDDSDYDNYAALEVALLNETSTTPIAKLNCKNDRKRAQKAVTPSYKRMNKYLSTQAKKLHICLDNAFNGFMAFRQSLMLVDTENYNLIDDQFYTDYKNDQRWNRRSNVLNLGRNMGSQAMSYGDVARMLSGQLSGQLDKVTGSLMTVAGYFGARNDTYFPSMYLSGYGGMNNQLVSTMNNAGSAYPGGMGVV